jgi:hypothetical protein
VTADVFVSAAAICCGITKMPNKKPNAQTALENIFHFVMVRRL